MIALTNALWTNFELVKKTWVNEKNECVIKLLNDATLNDLLTVCLPAVEIHEVEKVRPNMHDIFIESVREPKTWKNWQKNEQSWINHKTRIPDKG